MRTIWKENGIFEGIGKERSESLWIQKQYRYESENKEYKVRPVLKEDIKADAAVIGAGLAGILTASLLQEKGIQTVVLESQETGSGITKNTTAKISSQHGLIYQNLLRYKGEERAWEYAMANQHAIEKFEEMVNGFEINCDYQILPNYVYSIEDETCIRQEVEAAKRLGLPASFTRETELPFPVKGAVRFDRQAQFHPLKFLDAVAEKLTVYEHTRVTKICEDGLILTDHGSVRAKSIVIATHYPFINVPGFYFFRMHQEREYAVALEGVDIEKRAHLSGMYRDANPNGLTFRNYRNYLIFGCGKHRTGKYKPLDAYASIEQQAKLYYPNASIKYAWSNQDCMTPDSIPYIGRYSVYTPNMYVATGFNKWGMTGSMAAAMILSDMIAGKENEYHKVFYPQRLMLSGSGKFLKDAAITTKSLLKEHMKLPHDKLKDIKIGEGGVINNDGERLGVYRATEEKYYFVTTKCPHLGCSLEWNQNELTWDCPCHGSRFDYKGNLISNPATRNIFDSCLRKKK